MTDFLTGVRVLEAGGGIAVGYAGKLLADQGAEVVRRVDDDPVGPPLAGFLHAGKRDHAVDDG